jgi:hemolysin III
MDVGADLAARPVLRGYIHLVAAVAAPLALVSLLIVADSPRDFVGAAIFGTSLILLFTISGLYHVPPWSARYRGVLRKADHSMIFFFIAGAYTPFALKLLGNAWGIPFLSVLWGLAGVGAVTKLVAPRAPRWLGVSVYLTAGWTGLIPAMRIAANLDAQALVLIASAALLYSAGGIMYLCRWPNVLPGIFGFHEMFHSTVVVASGMLYFVIAVHVLPF